MSKIKDIRQTDLVGMILLGLDKLGVKEAEPRIINKCIECANLLLDELRRDPTAAAPGMGLAAWLASDDTGASSRYMAYKLAGGPFRQYVAYPYDPGDFGRCLRFLEAVPEAVPRLAKMAECGPVWAAYIKHWPEMEALYREERPTGTAPKLHAMMQELRDAAIDQQKETKQ